MGESSSGRHDEGMTDNRTPPPPAPSIPTRLLRRDPDGAIGGVASGLAEYFELDVVVVRLAFVVAALTFGTGPLFYLIGWLVIPKRERKPMPPMYTPSATPTPVTWEPEQAAQ